MKDQSSKVALRDTRYTDDKTDKDLSLQIPNYTRFHKKANVHKSNGVGVFIFNELDFKFLQYLNSNNSDIENLSIEWLLDPNKNILVEVI